MLLPPISSSFLSLPLPSFYFILLLVSPARAQTLQKTLRNTTSRLLQLSPAFYHRWYDPSKLNPQPPTTILSHLMAQMQQQLQLATEAAGNADYGADEATGGGETGGGDTTEGKGEGDGDGDGEGEGTDAAGDTAAEGAGAAGTTADGDGVEVGQQPPAPPSTVDATVTIVRASGLAKADFSFTGKGVSDPFCEVRWNGDKVHKTKVIDNQLVSTSIVHTSVRGPYHAAVTTHASSHHPHSSKRRTRQPSTPAPQHPTTSPSHHPTIPQNPEWADESCTVGLNLDGKGGEMVISVYDSDGPLITGDFLGQVVLSSETLFEPTGTCTQITQNIQSIQILK